MGNCSLPGCADTLLNAKNAIVAPAKQRTKPTKTRRLKKADPEGDFFFIGNFPGVYSATCACYRSGQALVTLFFFFFYEIRGPRSRGIKVSIRESRLEGAQPSWLCGGRASLPAVARKTTGRMPVGHTGSPQRVRPTA